MEGDFNGEIEFNNLLRKIKDDGTKQVINAFNEGYMLGRKHAEAIFNERSQNE